MSIELDPSSAPAGRVSRGLYRPETPWGAPTALLAALLIMLASVGLPILAMLGVVYLANPDSSFDINLVERFMATLSRPDSGLGLALIAAPQAVVLALTWWLAGLRGGTRRGVLALDKSGAGYATTLGAVVLLLLASALFDLVVYFFFQHDFLADIRAMTPLLTSPLWPLFLLAVVVGAPLSEEFLFRGFLFSALAGGRLGVIGAALVTDAMWTLLHVFNGYSLYGMVSIFVVGLLLSALLWRTGSIWVPIACHGANNLLAMVIGLWLVSQS